VCTCVSALRFAEVSSDFTKPTPRADQSPLAYAVKALPPSLSLEGGSDLQMMHVTAWNPIENGLARLASQRGARARVCAGQVCGVYAYIGQPLGLA
jgi:hypothetical protein